VKRVLACDHCGIRFKPYRTWQRFCSKEHRWAFHNAKRLRNGKAPEEAHIVLTDAQSEQIAMLFRRMLVWPPNLTPEDRIQIRNGPSYWLMRWSFAFKPYGISSRVQIVLEGRRLAQMG